MFWFPRNFAIFSTKKLGFFSFIKFRCKIRLVLLILGEIRQIFGPKKLEKNPNERVEGKKNSK